MQPLYWQHDIDCSLQGFSVFIVIGAVEQHLFAGNVQIVNMCVCLTVGRPDDICAGDTAAVTRRLPPASVCLSLEACPVAISNSLQLHVHFS